MINYPNYNYSYSEIAKISNNPEEQLIWTYLHFKFEKEINRNFHRLLGIDISYYPDEVIVKKYNKYYSYFCVVPDCYISYKDVIFRTDISPEARMYYLYLASICPVYYEYAWIPEEFILKDMTELVSKKLAVKEFKGFTLPKEKRFDKEGL